jgi:hypothetical protein
MKKFVFVNEIPKGSYLKYEFNKGLLSVKRKNNIPCPYNYGYIKDLFLRKNGVGDGEEVDAFLVNFDDILLPGTMVEVQVVGGWLFTDEKNNQEWKLLVVPSYSYDGAPKPCRLPTNPQQTDGPKHLSLIENFLINCKGEELAKKRSLSECEIRYYVLRSLIEGLSFWQWNLRKFLKNQLKHH